MTTLTNADRRDLGRLTTRDDAGQHFTALYPDEWLARMEAAGYITINRPIHAATGIPYGQEEWSVEVAEEVADWFDTAGNLICDL